MKYAVKNIEFKNNAWTAKVGKYKDCFCEFNDTKQTVIISQNKRPSKQDFINSYKNSFN